MSRITDVIARSCPDGVPIKPLGEVGTFIRGNGLQKKDLVDEGLGAIHYGQVFTTYGTATRATKSFVVPELGVKLRRAQPGDLVVATTSENDEDVCKAVAWLGTSEVAISGDAYLYSHTLDPLYVAYYFQSESFQAQKRRYITGTKVKRVSGVDLARISVPVPPIEVQREIASILEMFEELEGELEAELDAELGARRRQYKHYRDELLTFAHGRAQWLTLDQISVNHDSKRRPVTKAAREPGDIPYYGASGIVDYVSEYIFDGDYLLISEDGANLLARSSPIAFSISGRTWVNNHAHVLEFDSYAMRRLIEIYLNATDLAPFVTGAAQPKLNKANLNQIPVPVPPAEELERVVALFDALEALVDDLTTALPTELKARRQQYEYYRDKLLSFPEAA